MASGFMDEENSVETKKGENNTVAAQQPGQLRPRQLNQLNSAILEYFIKHYPQLAEQFQTQTKVFPPREEDVLVTKWAATTRMSLRIMTLEKEIASLKQKLDLHLELTKLKPQSDGLPNDKPKSILMGHRKAVTAVVFHPLFQLIATSSEDTTVKIWEFETNNGGLEATLSGHLESVNDVCFDKTGRWLASASSDTSVKIWNFTKMECQRSLYGHSNSVSSIKFLHSNAKLLLSASWDKSSKLWDSSTGDCLKTFCGHDQVVKSVAACPQVPGLFATASADFTIGMWFHAIVTEKKNDAYGRRHSGARNTLEEPLTRLSGHEHVVDSVIFASNKVLNVLLAKKKGAPPLNSAQLTAESESEMTSYSMFNREPVRTENTPGDPIDDGSVVPTDPIMKTCGPVVFSASRDCSIIMWDALAANQLMKYTGHENWVKHIVCHPNGEFLISCSDDRSIRIWDIVGGTMFHSITAAHKAFITCIAMNQQNCLSATVAIDNSIHIWASTHRSALKPHAESDQTEISTELLSEAVQSSSSEETADAPVNAKARISIISTESELVPPQLPASTDISIKATASVSRNESEGGSLQLPTFTEMSTKPTASSSRAHNSSKVPAVGVSTRQTSAKAPAFSTRVRESPPPVAKSGQVSGDTTPTSPITPNSPLTPATPLTPITPPAPPQTPSTTTFPETSVVNIMSVPAVFATPPDTISDSMDTNTEASVQPDADENDLCPPGNVSASTISAPPTTDSPSTTTKSVLLGDPASTKTRGNWKRTPSATALSASKTSTAATSRNAPGKSAVDNPTSRSARSNRPSSAT